MKRLLIKEVEDTYAQENFLRIEEGFREQVLLKGQWKFVELTFGAASTNFRFKHNLSFTPKDIILTSKTGAGTATFSFDLFTNEFLDISVTAATVLRFFVGSYQEASRF